MPLIILFANIVFVIGMRVHLPRFEMLAINHVLTTIEIKCTRHEIFV